MGAELLCDGRCDDDVCIHPGIAFSKADCRVSHPEPSTHRFEPPASHWQVLPTATRAEDVASGWLRGIAGDAIADGLHRDARGRPRLPAGMGDIGWSHSHGRLLVAHCRQGRVGVDVEASHRDVDPLRVARRYFAAQETAALHALAGDARTHAFLRLWCAKEAVLKAHGHGLSFGLHRVVFDATDTDMRMLACDPALGAIDDWCLRESRPEPGFIAVVAIQQSRA